MAAARGQSDGREGRMGDHGEGLEVKVKSDLSSGVERAPCTTTVTLTPSHPQAVGGRRPLKRLALRKPLLEVAINCPVLRARASLAAAAAAAAPRWPMLQVLLWP